MVETSEFRVGNYILYNNMPAIVQGMSEDSVLINGNCTSSKKWTRKILLVINVFQKWT
jgi:hypothetical protein